MFLSGHALSIVKIISAYGIIQVLAQDLGIKTGKKLRDLAQKIFLMQWNGIVVFSGSML